jgi:predicted DNA-binding WGR domain protein
VDHAHTPEIRPMAEPLQLPLFPDQAALTRIRPERNEWRYYRLAVWPDLFGRALLARQWGRIGTQGRVRLDPHPDAGAAINALARLAHAKRRRGYRGPADFNIALQRMQTIGEPDARFILLFLHAVLPQARLVAERVGHRDCAIDEAAAAHLGDGASAKSGHADQSSEGAALALPPGPRRPWTRDPKSVPPLTR